VVPPATQHVAIEEQGGSVSGTGSRHIAEGGKGGGHNRVSNTSKMYGEQLWVCCRHDLKPEVEQKDLYAFSAAGQHCPEFRAFGWLNLCPETRGAQRSQHSVQRRGRLSVFWTMPPVTSSGRNQEFLAHFNLVGIL
jgi:hypothetical protein